MEEFHKLFIHQDIKPQNMMIDSQGNLFFIDFGLAEEKKYNSDQYIWGTVTYNSIEKSITQQIFENEVLLINDEKTYTDNR